MYSIHFPAHKLILGHQSRRLTFMRNRGALSEGWYDATTKKKADAVTKAPRSPSPEPEPPTTRRRGSPDYGAIAPAVAAEEESDDEFGPALPSQTTVGQLATGPRGFEKRVGPAIPNVQDLEYRDGMFDQLIWIISIAC